MNKNKKYLLVEFSSEKNLQSTVEKIKDYDGVKITDLFSPYPLNESLMNKIKLKSLVGEITLLGGIIGGFLALLFQIWVNTKAYQLTIGGKPQMALLSYVPVVFEGMVLFAALFLVAALFIHFRGRKYKKMLKYEIKTSDDAFAIQLLVEANNLDEVKQVLENQNPAKILIQENV